MSTIEAVIFDLDGLMIENEGIQLESFNETLTRYHVHLTEHDFVGLVGKTQKEIFGEIKKKFGIHETLESLARRKREKYIKLIEQKLEPRTGLDQLIDWVNSRGLRKGIASSSPKEDVFTVLRVIGLESEFETVVSSFELSNGKPYPDVFIEAADALHVRRDCCVALEDSAIGAEAAKDAGMKCIVVPSSFTKHQNFTKADCVVTDLVQAKEVLEAWHNGAAENK